MAHDLGSSPRGQRLLAVGAVCALAVATAAAFGRVFTGAHAVPRLIGVALTSALLAAALERRNLVLATLVSAAGLLMVVGAVVFPTTTFYGLPTMDTLHTMGEAAGQIGRQADAQVAPTPPLAPLFLAAVTATWAAIFSAHALAVRAGSPLLALLPPVALVAFADTVLEETERPLYGVLFLATALLVVFFDALRRVQRWGPAWVWPGAGGGLASVTGRGARRVAALALGVATILPLTLPGFGTSALIDLSGGSSGESVRLSPLVSIKASLTLKDPIELFTVRSDRASYWRMASLDTFDGVTWKATAGAAETDVNSATPLAELRPYGSELQQSFTVADQDIPFLLGLPVASPAIRVDYPGDLTYDADQETLSPRGDAIEAGTTYQVQSNPVQPPPSKLEAVRFPEDVPNTLYTSVPGGLPQEIGAIAKEWVAGTTTDYDAIRAIQDHLSSSEFRYDVDVAARDDQFTLVDFLTKTKAGMCQQFASAMAVMLRTLDYPTRVAVGFTQGAETGDDGVLHVTTANYHAWVEVQFPTYGWLAFEPTPNHANPVANSYDNPAEVCLNDQGLPCTRRPAGAGAPAGTGQRLNVDLTRRSGVRGGSFTLPSERSGGTVTPEPFRVSTGLVLLLLGGLAALAGLLIPLVRAGRRRLRLRRAGPEPRRRILAIYDVFDARAAEMGWARRLGETLQEYPRRLAAAGIGPSESLSRLITLTGRAAYADGSADADGSAGADEAEEADRAAAATLRDLRRSTPIARRIVGRYLPEQPTRN